MPPDTFSATGRVPSKPKAIAFVDAQNLFHDAEREFGYSYPNFDIVKLCDAVCGMRGWERSAIRFYTGVPTEAQNFRYKRFWDNKIFTMRLAKVDVFPRVLKNRVVSIRLFDNLTVYIPPRIDGGEYTSVPTDPPWATHCGRGLTDGTVVEQVVFTEKGIDVGIAVDAIRHALRGAFDVCLFFSQDTDLDPAVKEIKEIGRTNGRQFVVASAFPLSTARGGGYGIPGTVPVPIDKNTYDRCIDPKDYFPKSKPRR